MTWIWILIAGLTTGIGGTIVVTNARKPPPQEQVASAQQDVIKQLTDTDILSVPCSKKYLEEHGDNLCRLMFCWQMSRGIDSQTAGADCEQISNIANSIQIQEVCWQYKDPDERRDCEQLFEKRK